MFELRLSNEQVLSSSLFVWAKLGFLFGKRTWELYKWKETKAAHYAQVKCDINVTWQCITKFTGAPIRIAKRITKHSRIWNNFLQRIEFWWIMISRLQWNPAASVKESSEEFRKNLEITLKNSKIVPMRLSNNLKKQNKAKQNKMNKKKFNE